MVKHKPTIQNKIDLSNGSGPQNAYGSFSNYYIISAEI